MINLEGILKINAQREKSGRGIHRSVGRVKRWSGGLGDSADWWCESSIAGRGTLTNRRHTFADRHSHLQIFATAEV